jgi:wobble nucleotide-excising tRNase
VLNKIPSEILSIELKEACYSASNCSIKPTYVNFFFGNNGAGKSTIAKTIFSGIGVSYATGRSATDYLHLIYNQDFIDENFSSYRDLKGVFTLNARNASVQQQIDTKIQERSDIQKQQRKANEMLAKKVEASDRIKKEFYKACWDREKGFREEFSRTQSGKGKSEPFTKEILKHTSQNLDIDEFRRLYDSVFSDNAKRYSRFTEITNSMILDQLYGSDILAVSIVNSSETELAGFLKTIGATEWMRGGHDTYSDKAGERCPYCGQGLPDNFEQIFIDSFDNQYQINLKKLDDFLERYRNTANTLFLQIQKIPAELYPQIDIKPFTEKLNVLKAAIQENIDEIKKKKAEPSIKASIKPVASILEELSGIIDGFNQLIDENNIIVDAGPKKRRECTDQAFSILAFRLRDIISAYKKENEEIAKEIDALNAELAGYRTSLDSIKNELKSLRKQTVETETAKDSINNMLRDSGMQGFSLQPKLGVEHVYEVRRPDGSIADNLSEGEKNFIAFLYFYHLVYGTDSADGETKDKIVVIDDPVSSMDSGSLFIVSTLVRQMIEVCRNNANNRNALVDGNFIKQIFILTHNAYFHREVTQGYLNKYEYASFFLIRKMNSHSTVKLCDAVNPYIPTERMNINPVKNSYAALWEEYRQLGELDSPIPLMNVIRRILEFYFLQLCGYEGANLRKKILIEGKAQGKFKDSDGNEDEEKFQLAAAMLSYINTSSTGMYDGIDYVDGCLNTAECKAVFEMIFESMEQKQHYDMMMGIQH